MIPWLQIDTTRVPGADVELRLMRRGAEFSMMLGQNELMNKRTQGSKPTGAVRLSEMPGFIRPQLATLKSKAPAGSQWLHEIKFDGYRVQIHLNKGRRKVYTRNGLDWTKRFSLIAGAMDVPGQAIIDGEVVVIHEGRTNCSELQAELAAGRQDRLVYYAFDLL
jgi:ATP-dependent DNA ligase